MTDHKEELFWTKLQKEIKETPDIYYFEFHLESQAVKNSKFRVILNKVFSIVYEGIDSAKGQNETLQNLWLQTVRHFSHLKQIQYLEQLMEKIKSRYFILIAIFFSKKTLFASLETIVEKTSYLYLEPKSKLIQLQASFKKISFLQSQKIIVLGQHIQSYDEFLQKQREKQKILAIRIQEEKRKAQLLKKQQEDKRQRERMAAQKEAAMNLQRSKEIKETFQKNNALIQRQIPIQSLMIPSQYKPIYKQTLPSKQTPRTPQQTQYIKEQRKTYRKRSEQLFQTRYKYILQTHSFRSKPEQNTNKMQCFQCKRPLTIGFLSMGGNTNFCNYTGQWFCNDHMSLKRYPIPWRAIQQFDLRGYAVSLEAENEISKHYNSVLIQLKLDNPIINHKKALYQFLVVKRQLHLIYDSICNGDFITSLIENKMNYCLQRNLFSLKNLYDMYNGQQVHALQNYVGILSNHFVKCEICQKKKGYLCGKCKKPPKIFPFELKDCYGCKRCMKLYHRTCLVNSKCQCEIQ